MSKIIDLIDSYIERDPAAKGRIEVFFTSPGLHAIGIYRLSNFLWSFCSAICFLLLTLKYFIVNIVTHCNLLYCWWLLPCTFGLKKEVEAMACSMLFISLGAFEINPAVMELLLCWIALEPATVTFSMDLSFTLYPSLGSSVLRRRRRRRLEATRAVLSWIFGGGPSRKQSRAAGSWSLS